MANRIAHAQGRPADANPWKTKKRKHVDSPTIKLGVMLDVSGSMRRVAKSTMELGWAFAHAGFRIQATTAMVSYGDEVTPLVYPHERPESIPSVEVWGSGESFKLGFDAINSQLDLLGGTGPRLLVIVSDGHYVWIRDEEYNSRIMPQLVRDGVHVLRLSPGRFSDHRNLPSAVEQVIIDGSFEQMVHTAGRAAVKLLERG
jgi:hypothetical protein